MYARAVTWWTILRICLNERLVYRGDFMLGTLMRFLPIVTQIFLWYAVFQSIAATRGSEIADVRLQNYSYHQFVGYYLLTMLSRAFSSMPGLASGITRQIRDGEVKKYLIQPVDMLGFLVLGRVAHKLAYYTVAIVPFGLVFFLAWSWGYFSDLPPESAAHSAGVFGAYLASLVMGFILGYYLEASIGLIGFWWLEVSSLLFVYMLLNFFLSGHMFPLDMLPEPWKTAVDLLPFRYLAYFPAAVFLGKITGWELVLGLAVEAAWIFFFICTSRIMLWRGLKRYSGFGG